MQRTLRIAAIGFVLAIACLASSGVAASAADGDDLLAAMETELARSMKGLAEKGDPPPYFIGYYVSDADRAGVTASFGAVRESGSRRVRLLDVEVRVGSYELDSSHRLRGEAYRFSFEPPRPVPIPLEDDPDALRAAIWLETDSKYKSALEKLVQVRSNTKLQVEEEAQTADFSREEPQVHLGEPARLEVDLEPWKDLLRDYSAMFSGIPEIHESSVALRAVATNRYVVSSEGTRVREGRVHWRLAANAETRADDGMELARFEAFDAATVEGLPGPETVKKAIRTMIDDLLALREAPTIEPFAGPAILSGRASGVFFHEIFGHRIEGHRQKDEQEGQTFTKKVGQPVLPDFLSVFDDPTRARLGAIDLNGHYLYDDEGVKARRVPVVEKGILRNFLMSRSPLEGFPQSNGHGRKQAGFRAVGRQGNLMVEASETVPMARLREMLIEESRRQGKDFGLLFDDISGGFTTTRRSGPQAFQVTPIMVYRVFTDGRPDELVRGVNLIGTPLASFSEILAASDEVEVFNGSCGAESGWVPVSASSPSILTGRIEISKKEKSSDRPPLLPAPTREVSP